MKTAALACLAVACLVAGAAAQAADNGKVFKAIGDYLGYKPADTDTLFVPTDAAFAALAKQYGLKSPTEFLSPRYEALLARVGAYHIHEDAPLKAAQLKDGQKLDTLLKGESLTLQKSGNDIIVKGATNSAKVMLADRKDGTAVVHLIDKVLIPPNVYVSVYDAVTTRPDLSAWGKLFASDPNVKAKSSAGLFMGTYFAPSDAGVKAFEADDKTTIDKAFGGQDRLELVLYFHSTPLPHDLASIRNLSSNAPIKSSLSVGGVAEPIYHEKNGSSANVWGILNVKDRATITTPDILVGGGFLHIIDYVMVPDLDTAVSQNMAAAVANRSDLSHMASMLKDTGIAGHLASPMFQGTLLAPTNKAFEDLAKKMGFAKVDDLYKLEPVMDSIMAYHLMPAPYTAQRLKQFAPFTAKPFGGGPNAVLRFKSDGGKLSVVGVQNTANVVDAGIDAGRSVVHVLDTVLLPETVFPTIMDALEYHSAASILENLVAMTPELAKVARDPTTKVTVFAPRNQAFLDVSPMFVEAAEEAPAAVRLAALQYHISPGARFIPAGFKDGESLPTLLKGQDLKVSIKYEDDAGKKGKAGRVVLTPTGGPAATVNVINIAAGQSVIQGIDRVLLSKEVSSMERAGS